MRAISGDAIPVGRGIDRSITEWHRRDAASGQSRSRPGPYGLDADDIIGGQPGSHQPGHTLGPCRRPSLSSWWQLSPPGFPDRWIEVNAEIGGQEFERQEMIASIEAVLETLEFQP